MCDASKQDRQQTLSWSVAMLISNSFHTWTGHLVINYILSNIVLLYPLMLHMYSCNDYTNKVSLILSLHIHTIGIVFKMVNKAIVFIPSTTTNNNNIIYLYSARINIIALRRFT